MGGEDRDEAVNVERKKERKKEWRMILLLNACSRNRGSILDKIKRFDSSLQHLDWLWCLPASYSMVTVLFPTGYRGSGHRADQSPAQSDGYNIVHHNSMFIVYYLCITMYIKLHISAPAISHIQACPRS
jgi:hypothetical protein